MKVFFDTLPLVQVQTISSRMTPTCSHSIPAKDFGLFRWKTIFGCCAMRAIWDHSEE